MKNWKVGEWYYVVLDNRFCHLFKYNGESNGNILLKKTHWDLGYSIPKNTQAEVINKSRITFAKRVTEKEALLLQSGVKFENLPKRNVYELWD